MEEFKRNYKLDSLKDVIFILDNLFKYIDGIDYTNFQDLRQFIGYNIKDPILEYFKEEDGNEYINLTVSIGVVGGEMTVVINMSYITSPNTEYSKRQFYNSNYHWYQKNELGYESSEIKHIPLLFLKENYRDIKDVNDQYDTIIITDLGCYYYE